MNQLGRKYVIWRKQKCKQQQKSQQHMGNEKGRKRLDSIKDIFREKGSQKWTFPFQFQFCHKVFQVHISESSAIMFQFNAYRPIKNQSQTFFESRLGGFGRKTFQDLLGHNDVRGDHQTTAFVVVSSLSSSAYFHKANFCR